MWSSKDISEFDSHEFYPRITKEGIHRELDSIIKLSNLS